LFAQYAYRFDQRPKNMHFIDPAAPLSWPIVPQTVRIFDRSF